MSTPNDVPPGSEHRRPIALWIRVGVLLFTSAAASYMVLSAQSEHNDSGRQLSPVKVVFAKKAAQAAPQAGSIANGVAVQPTADAGTRPLDALNPAKRKNDFGIAGPSSKSDPHMAREEAMRQAIESGIIKTLAGETKVLDAGSKR